MKRLHVETSVEDGTPHAVDIGGGPWEGYKAGMRAAAISAGMSFDDAALKSCRMTMSGSVERHRGPCRGCDA